MYILIGAKAFTNLKRDGIKSVRSNKGMKDDHDGKTIAASDRRVCNHGSYVDFRLA